MDPLCIGSICIDVGLELGGLLLATVGAIATIMHHRHQKAHHAQQERHHQERLAAGKGSSQ